MDGGSDAIEIPLGTKFAFDVGSLEAGYVMFGPQGPVRVMKPYIEGEPPVPRPQDKDVEGKYIFRPGFYVKIAGNALDGVREWCSNAAVLLNAMDELYQQVIKAPEAAAGQIPLISIVATTAVKSGSGARTSTNYGPVLKIDGWVPRPDILGPRTVPPPNAHNGHSGYTPAPPAAVPFTPPVATQPGTAQPASPSPATQPAFSSVSVQPPQPSAATTPAMPF
jgi:hypothetical protein